MENKQTVVEWLQEALEHTIFTHEQIMQTIGLFEQAKEMEKEQIIQSVLYGIEDIHDVGDIENEKLAEQYYNKIFKSK